MVNVSHDESERRAFIRKLSAIGTASLFGLAHTRIAAQPAIETKRIRFVHAPSICIAPIYLAEEILRMDGFTDIQYLPLRSRMACTRSLP